MIRTALLTCVLLTAAAALPARASDKAGEWTASVSENHPEFLQISLHLGPHEQDGTRMKLSEFSGLEGSQIHSPSRVNVQFELRREAGTIAFDGMFHDGHGAGEFTFTANRDFTRQLHGMGLQFSTKKSSEEDALFELAIFDVSTDFIHSMQAIGYDVPLEMYEQFRIFDVNPDYVRDMDKVGFDHLPAEKLVETRIHGATPDYIRQMRASGDDLTLDQYVESRIFQVTPEFAAEMAKDGYPGLKRDVLVQFRIQGVTTEFIREIGNLGYTHVPAEKLVEMRIHGVTPQFIKRVAAAGYRDVPIDKLVQMRIFNIEPEMVRALDDASRKGKTKDKDVETD